MQIVSPHWPVLAVGTAFLVSSLVTSAGAQSPNIVEGTVRTANGQPVRGATIRIAGATGAGRGTTIKATTDANGRYSVKVPLGHYDVDGFADIEFGGQTYREILLDRGNATCERAMSTNGIVRNFMLRLSGAKRCLPGHDPANPNSYNGAYITAMTSDLPDDAVITFTLTPLGPLADGTVGRPLTFTRSGAALRGSGRSIAESQFLHDIPLGRYRVAAEVRHANGTREGTTLALNDGGDTSGSTLDITFQANVLGGGIRPVGIGVSAGEPAHVADAHETPDTAEAPEPPLPPANSQPPAAPPAASPAELPRGRYACSYRSEYAGDIPTGKSITIGAGGRYQAYDGSGTYTLDTGSGAVQWTGPLGEGDVKVTFGKRNGMPALTVEGGGASEDPGRTNVCVLIGS